MNQKIYLSFLVLLLVSGELLAQPHLELDSYNGQAEIVASGSITFKPGFHVPAGQTMRAYIDPLAAGDVPLASTPSQDQNYIIHNRYLRGGVDPDNLQAGDVSQTITYYDGLGRRAQIVTTKGSPTLKDVVQPIEYDPFGREVKKRLPYTGGTNGAFKPNAPTTQASFYNNPPTGVQGAAYPYAQTVFEPSPLNRVLEQGFPGGVYQPATSGISGSGHTVKTGYSTNTTGEVRLFQIEGATVKAPGHYAPGQLYKTITKDENWTSGKAGTTEEFIDKQGRVVLKRVWETETKKVSTYYVYDDFGDLRVVIPQPANPDNGGTISQTMLNNYCYQYKYDGRRRLIEKRLPGKEKEYFVYNKLDQVVYSQDGRLREGNNWIFYKYDGIGREIIKGFMKVSSGTTPGTLQSAVNNQAGPLWEEPKEGTATGYTNRSLPNITNVLDGGGNFYQLSYYSDYTLPADCPSTLKNGPSGHNPHVRGLLTATKTKILGNSDFLWTVYYYDSKGRQIQSKAQNHLGGTDILSTQYNFTGQPTLITRAHTANGQTTTVNERYDYDHEGRLKNTYHKINNQSEVLLSSNTYNEVGELMTKKLHAENGSSPLQAIQYRYNIRGWLTQIESEKSGIDLLYSDNNTTGAAKQYNGNIAEMRWQSDRIGSNAYAFTYDKLNRLTKAITTDSKLNETITYGTGGTGNITKLVRGDHGTLNYTYGGTNQLQSVSGYITSSYAYDANGNLTKDAGKNITGIQYNYLNLPYIISRSTGGQIKYLYDATGKKLKQILSSKTRDYIDGIHYEDGALKFIQTSEGLARKLQNTYHYEYDLKDHLGNVRVRIDKNNGTVRVKQENEYYAFGLSKTRFDDGSDNRYLYNSKELQEGLGLYDYGARFYDPVTARFTTVDPLAENHYNFTPYHYVLNNPLKYIDPLGLDTIGTNDNTIPQKGDVVEVSDGDFVTASGDAVVVSESRSSSTSEDPEKEGWVTMDWAEMEIKPVMGMPPMVDRYTSIRSMLQAIKSLRNLLKIGTRVSRIQANSLKEFKTLINQLSKPGSKLTQKEFNELQALAQKFGGTIRIDLQGVKGTGVNSHAHIEGLGKSVESRHIWLEFGVK